MKVELLHIAKHVQVQPHCSNKTETIKHYDDGDGDKDDGGDNGDDNDDDLT